MSLMVEQPGICISVYRSLFSASSALEFLERLELAIADEWDYPELLWKNSGVGSNNQISSHRTSISCPLISLSKPYPQTELSEFFKQEIDDKIHVAMIDYATENMLSTGMREPYSVLNHERPELWGEVKMRDEQSLQCDFLWHRSGDQIVGILDGKSDDRRRGGPGTCTYTVKGTDVEFFADAEWVLGPDILWDYDLNTMGGHQFVGRADRTHIKQYRARGYQCRVEDANGSREWHAHDRGATLVVTSNAKQSQRLMLLRAPLPDAAGVGMHDALRVALLPLDSEQPVFEVSAAPIAPSAELVHDGIQVRCNLVKDLPPMHAK